ncbi:tetratricopeptide repeat protein [Embleya sp. NPDC001921]
MAGLDDTRNHELGVPIDALSDPYALEVHRAVAVPGDRPGGEPTLPAYVEREHDAEVSAVVGHAAAGSSTLAVLVGGSSTGKTRACWEAVRRLPAPWRLWHPIDPSRAGALAAALADVGTHTVLWLNEMQHYLRTSDTGEGERIAAGLRELLRDPARGPVLVLGTMWPEYWEVLATDPPPGTRDAHSQARALLTGHGIAVPDAFSDAAMDALRHAVDTDARLAQAREHAEDGRITQYLAGIPALLERYRLAPAPARALIHAAMDLRRLGHGVWLPYTLLEAAAPGYLTDTQCDALGPDWSERAMAYATAPCRGADGPLTRVRPRAGVPESPQPLYRLSDYLEQHARAERRFLSPPASLWHAAAGHARTVEDATELATAAEERRRYRHAALIHQSPVVGEDPGHALDVAFLRHNLGDPVEATELLIVAAARGSARACRELGRDREDEGDLVGAEALYTLDPPQENSWTLRRRAGIYEHFGDLESAEALYAEAVARDGSAPAAAALARLRGEPEGVEVDAPDPLHVMLLRGRDHEREGDLEEAERLYREVLAAGGLYAVADLGRLAERAGDPAAAEALYLKDNVGHTEVQVSLVCLWERTGRRVAAEHRACEQLTETYNPLPVRELGLQRERSGDVTGAEALYRKVMDGGGYLDEPAPLADLWERTGRAEDAEGLRRRGLDADGSVAAPWNAAPDRLVLARARAALGIRLLEIGRPMTALDYLEPAADEFTHLAASDPVHLPDLSHTLGAVCFAQLAAGDANGARSTAARFAAAHGRPAAAEPTRSNDPAPDRQPRRHRRPARWSRRSLEHDPPHPDEGTSP